jgi:hypothetical protein
MIHHGDVSIDPLRTGRRRTVNHASGPIRGAERPSFPRLLILLLVCLALVIASGAMALDATPVQVGTRGDVIQAHLDFHRASGNLFAVALTDENFFWTWYVNISTDGGATWTETYEWQSTMEIVDIDAVVVDDYLYVAYIDPLDNRYSKIRRFSAIDGAVDTTFGTGGWMAVHDADPGHVEEVALASSADSSGVRLYYFAIQSDGALRYSWTNQEGGADTPWGEIDTTVTSANHNLEAAYAGNSSTFLYASYEALDGDIHVWRRMSDPVASDVTDLNLDARDWVRISAFEDTVAIVYDFTTGPDRGIDTAISTDAGDTWVPGSLTPLDNYTSPGVTLRGGGGIWAVYHDVTTPDFAALTRKDYSGGSWSTPIDCSIPALRTGTFSDVQAVPRGEVGVLFVGSGTSFKNVFFATPMLLFSDDFELGDITAWSSSTSAAR